MHGCLLHTLITNHCVSYHMWKQILTLFKDSPHIILLSGIYLCNLLIVRDVSWKQAVEVV